MTTYCVECYWPGVRQSHVVAALRRLGGERLVWLDTILIPADEIVLCVVEGESKPAIRAAAVRAGLRPERIVECVQVVRP